MPNVDLWSDVTQSGSVPELERYLIGRIEAKGPIPFAEFMTAALYHPSHGYYTGAERRIGRDGDYVTSPEVHPVFGALIARQVIDFWDALGQPEGIRIIEAGAGNGSLARDLIATLNRAAAFTFRYVIVEPHPSARSRQQETLGENASAVRWAEDMRTLEPEAATIVLSNELLDAFPVHRVTVREGRLRELYVDYESSLGFHDHEGAPSSPEIKRYFSALGLLPGDGCVAEVNLEAPLWMRQAASVMTTGFALTFDYGAPADELYARWRTGGTLLTCYRHAWGQDPYIRIGRQDITAHVDFTTLVAAGRTAGLELLGFARQSDVLTALGITEGMEGPGMGHLAVERQMARRQATLELLDPAGLGRVRVLAQGKGVGLPQLKGFPDGPPVDL